MHRPEDIILIGDKEKHESVLIKFMITIEWKLQLTPHKNAKAF